MAKLEKFIASMEIASGLKPSGQNTFPLVQAHDILVGYDENNNEIRLDDKLENGGNDGITPHIGEDGYWYIGDEKQDVKAKGEQGPTGESSQWYWGTGITGTAQTPKVFINSGITMARACDMYLNTDTYNVYYCVKGGYASEATWSYRGNIKGDRGPQGPEGVGIPGENGKTPMLKAENNMLFMSYDTSDWLYLCDLPQGPQGEKGDSGGVIIDLNAESTTNDLWDAYREYVNNGATVIFTIDDEACAILGDKMSEGKLYFYRPSKNYIVEVTGNESDGGTVVSVEEKINYSRWYTGTALTGTGTQILQGSTHGIVESKVGDMYLNEETGDVYACIKGGTWNEARWLYRCNLRYQNKAIRAITSEREMDEVIEKEAGKNLGSYYMYLGMNVPEKNYKKGTVYRIAEKEVEV